MGTVPKQNIIEQVPSTLGTNFVVEKTQASVARIAHLLRVPEMVLNR